MIKTYFIFFWSDNGVAVVYAVTFYPGTLCMTYVFVTRVHLQRLSQRINQRQLLNQRQVLTPALDFSTATSPMTGVDNWLPDGRDNFQGSENCLAVKRHVSCRGRRCQAPVYGWYSAACYQRKFYVCESDPISTSI